MSKLMRCNMILKIVFLILVFALLLTLAINTFFQNNMPDEKNSHNYSLLVNDTQASPYFIKLLDTTGLKHNRTLQNIVEITQREWLRPKGKELWELEEKHEDKRQEIKSLLKQLGCIYKRKPSKKRYTYGVIHGGTIHRIRKRLGYAVALWKDGIRFDHLVFLSGERPLDPTFETKEVLFDRSNTDLPIRIAWQPPKDMPTTEIETIKLIYDQADLPPDIRQLPIAFASAPMKKGLNGNMLRPTTNDTFKAWLKNNPKPGSCLLFSNQPYIARQHLVAKTLLPETFLLETVGQEANKNLMIAAHLDNLARWLYQECKEFQSRNIKKSISV